MIVSVTLSVIGLFIIGAAITIITGRNALLSGSAPGALRRGGGGDHVWCRPPLWRNVGRVRIGAANNAQR